jgi:hypothetical protein
MSKQIEYIIDDIRKITENEEFDSTVGLDEEEILLFCNQGLKRIHSRIIGVNPEAPVFTFEEEISTSVDTESYALSYKAHRGNRVLMVEYSYNSDPEYYFPLDRISPHQRDTGADGTPWGYFIRNSTIYLDSSPINSTGKLRITYIARARQLDKRRGQVEAIEGTATAPTALEIADINSLSTDQGEIDKRSYFCVVDVDGVIKMANIPITSTQTTSLSDAQATYQINVDSSNHTAESGETISVGDYVVSGRYVSTHLEEDDFEDYVREFAAYKVLKRDSSVDVQEAILELRELETELIDSFAMNSDDVAKIPEINKDDGFWE